MEEEIIKLNIDKNGQPVDRSLALSMVMVLASVANVDQALVPEEVQALVKSITQMLDFTDAQAAYILEVAQLLGKEDSRMDESIQILNNQLSTSQREEVLSIAWRIAMSDGVIDRLESALAVDLRQKLNLTPEHAVRARHKAEQRFNG